MRRAHLASCILTTLRLSLRQKSANEQRNDNSSRKYQIRVALSYQLVINLQIHSVAPNYLIMVELRKRKASQSAPPPPVKKANSVKSTASSAKSTATNNKAASNGSPKSKVAVGDTITLDGFGGEIETNDGEKTTLMKLVEDSKSGVVLFTYPKASTPGCK